jgi:hypothetical protein
MKAQADPARENYLSFESDAIALAKSDARINARSGGRRLLAMNAHAIPIPKIVVVQFKDWRIAIDHIAPHDFNVTAIDRRGGGFALPHCDPGPDLTVRDVILYILRRRRLPDGFRYADLGSA